MRSRILMITVVFSGLALRASAEYASPNLVWAAPSRFENAQKLQASLSSGRILAVTDGDAAIFQIPGLQPFNTANILPGERYVSGSYDSTAHTSAVLSADGNLCACYGPNGHLCIWNTNTRALLHRVPAGLFPTIRTVAFSPNNSVLYVVGGSSVIAYRLDGSGYTTVPTSSGLHAFSPDGRFVAYSTSTFGVEVKSTLDWHVVGTKPVHASTLLSLSYSPNTSCLVSTSQDGFTAVIAPDASQVLTKQNLGSSPTLVSISSSSDRIVFGNSTGLRTFSLPALSPLNTAAVGSINALTFGPGDQVFAVVRNVGTQVFSSTLGFSRSIGWHVTGIDSVAWSADGNWVASLAQKDAHLWSKKGAHIRSFNIEALTARDIAVSPSGAYTAIGCYDGVTRIYSKESSQPIQRLQFDQVDVYKVAFSNDGAYLLTVSYLANQNSRLDVYNTGDWSVAWTKTFTQWRPVANITPDSKKAVFTGYNNILQYCDLSNGTLIGTQSFSGDSFVFSPDSQWLASNVNGWIYVYPAMGVTFKTYAERGGPRTYGLALAPGATSILQLTEDFRVRRWNVSTGDASSPINQEVRKCFVSEFSPDRSMVALGREDGTLLVLRTTMTEATRFSPTNYTVVQGTRISGSVASFAARDSDSFLLRKVIGDGPNPTIEVQVEGVCPVADPKCFNFRSLALLSGGSATYRVHLWDWTTNDWDPLDTADARTDDFYSAIDIVATGNLRRYLDANGRMRARLRLVEPSFSTNSWDCSIGQAAWFVE